MGRPKRTHGGMEEGREFQAQWTDWAGTSLESLHLQITKTAILAESTIREADARWRYLVECDASWRTRRAHVEGESGSRELRSDGAGNWSDRKGGPLPMLRGCRDVDISGTPFTNTLPIRRLALGVGEAREVDVAYVATPELELSTERQRYTRLGPRRFLFESDGGAFSREIDVDAQGLVLMYPGLFRRVIPPGAPGD
jgi:hypothetical protein